MSSTVSSPDPIFTAVAGRPSYESFLRIKQGIGSEALRAAGLPAAENLSYDAYVAALNRKAAELRAAEPATATRATSVSPKTASDRTDAKHIAWASVVVVPVALVFVLLVADMFKDRPGIPSSSEAVAAPLTGDGLPVALAITTIDEMPSAALPADDDVPNAVFENEVAAASPPETVELLPAPAEPAPAAVVPKKKIAAAAQRSPAQGHVAQGHAIQANGAAVQERRVAAAKPEKAAAKPVRSAAKKQDDFWQPLVDLLNGKGVRGARNVPAPEDRAGR